MTGQLESAIVLEIRDTLKWESAILAPSQGTINTINPSNPIDPLAYQLADRQLGYRDIIVGAAIVDTSIEVSNVYNYQTIRPQLQGPANSALPFVASEITTFGTASLVRHVKNASIPWHANLKTDSDLYGRDALAYEILARACQAAFINPPIQRIDSAGTIFPNVTAWSLAQGAEEKFADINPAKPLNQSLFLLPDENLADRDNLIAAYVANLAQILKNPFTKAMRIYVGVTGPGTSFRENEIFVLTSDDGVNRVWQAEPALSDRNQIIYNYSNKTLQWIRETIDAVHIPQIYALQIPGIDAGQFLNTVPVVPEQKDAQFWRTKASLIVPAGEEISDTPYFLSYTASSAATGGITQIDSASLTTPGQLNLLVNNGTLASGAYRVSILVEPSPQVEIAGAQNISATSGTLGGATFEVNIPSGSIGTNQYIVEGGDGIIYNGTGYAAGAIFSGGTNVTTYTQADSNISIVRQYGLNFQLSLTPGNWNAAIEYTDLSGTSTGFGIKAVYTANGASAITVIEDVVAEPAPPLGEVVSTGTALFTVDNPGAFSFQVFWTYGTGSLHIRQLTFTNQTQTGHYNVTGNIGNGTLANVDCIGTAYQPDVMRFEFNAAEPITPVTFAANWIADPDMPLKVKQVDFQTIGTFSATPLSDEFSGWRQECLDRAERAVQQTYALAVQMFGTSVPTFRDSGSHWNPTATENWMSFVETTHPRIREVPNIDDDLGIIGGRQYKVVTGPVIYNGGTYQVSQTFFGNGTNTGFTGGSVMQVGAFKKALPGHIGRPCLLPFGLEYIGNGTVYAQYDTPQSIPVVVSAVPWMIDQGVYVAKEDFWMPDFLIVPQTQALPLPPVAGTPWTPAVVSPLHWYPADKITGFTNGQPLFNWQDRGTGNNAFGANSGGGTGLYLTNQLNGLPIVQVINPGNSEPLRLQNSGWTPGVNNILNPSWDGFSQANIFFVLQPTDVFNGEIIMQVFTSSGLPPGLLQLNIVNAGLDYGLAVKTHSTDSSTQITGTSPVTGGYDILAYQVSYVSALAALRVNGSAVFSGQGFNSAGSTLGSISTVLPGDNALNSTHNYAEIIIDVNNISLATIQKYEGYLAWKWGLQSNLPVGHPYKNSPPTV